MEQLINYFHLVDNSVFFRMDFPDVDVIRVEDTYYCITTTMHFFPGAQILVSKDLIHWKHKSYVYDVLDSTEGQKLDDGKGVYGKGMWAASLRYHEGMFYVCFVANDTGKTYLYRSDSITGPWKKNTIEGFYHDASLLFDEGHIYIAYGNRQIYITELNEEMTAPKEGGLHKLVIEDSKECALGYEGTSLLKINGTYYFFFVHSTPGEWRRTECCFYTDDLSKPVVGGEVCNEDLDYRYSGIAQGTIVDTPEGDWYGFLFQDRGAAGRMPVLMPVHFEGKQPVFESPMALSPELAKSDDSFVDSNSLFVEKDYFQGKVLNPLWQFNHEPDFSLLKWGTNEHGLSIKTDRIVSKLTQVKNIITGRLTFPECVASVLVDGSCMKDGDLAGICALQGKYGFAALQKNTDGYCVVMASSTEDGYEIVDRIPVKLDPEVRLRMSAHFGGEKEFVQFSYWKKNTNSWETIGKEQEVTFALDHFTGCRVGLFQMATENVGGIAKMREYVFTDL